MQKSPVFDFSARTALVTGATSGIGEAVSVAFARAGASVAASGRNRERGESVVAQIAAAGGNASFLAADVTDSTQCDALVRSAVEAYSGIDVLVNCAGIIYHATGEQTSDAQWHDTMRTNVDSVFFMSRAVLPKLRERGGGVIVNIASDAGLSGSPHLVAYCASKGAVIQLTRAMAIDHAAEGIRVVAVCPGDVDTPMLRGEFEQRAMAPEHGLEQSAAGVPLGRVCSAAEVAELVLYVASDAARFMTGTPVALDGGSRA